MVSYARLSCYSFLALTLATRFITISAVRINDVKPGRGRSQSAPADYRSHGLPAVQINQWMVNQTAKENTSTNQLGMQSWTAFLKDFFLDGKKIFFQSFKEDLFKSCGRDDFGGTVGTWTAAGEVVPQVNLLCQKRQTGKPTLTWQLTTKEVTSYCPSTECPSPESAGKVLNFEVSLLKTAAGLGGSCAIFCHLPPPYHHVDGTIERLCNSNRVYLDLDDDGNLERDQHGQIVKEDFAWPFHQGNLMDKGVPSKLIAQNKGAKYDYVLHVGCMPAQCPAGLRNTRAVMKATGRLAVMPSVSLFGKDFWAAQTLKHEGFGKDSKFAASRNLREALQESDSYEAFGITSHPLQAKLTTPLPPWCGE